MWEAAELLMAEIDRLAPLVVPHNPSAADHLLRSGESVLFNIGEGVAAYRPKVKIAVYEIAKREANEIRAILRRLVIQKVLTNDDTARAYNLAGAEVGMLTNAIKTLGKPKDDPEKSAPDSTG